MTTEDGTAICIPNYPSSAPNFIGGDIGRPTPYNKGGYLRNYETYLSGSVSLDATICDPNSTTDFCYSSVPASLGLSGVRAFNGTPAGTIFYDQTGTAIPCPVPSSASPLSM
jgi:hypothetical protein